MQNWGRVVGAAAEQSGVSSRGCTLAQMCFVFRFAFADVYFVLKCIPAALLHKLFCVSFVCARVYFLCVCIVLNISAYVDVYIVLLCILVYSSVLQINGICRVENLQGHCNIQIQNIAV